MLMYQSDHDAPGGTIPLIPHDAAGGTISLIPHDAPGGKNAINV